MKLLLIAINAKYIHSNLAVYCLKACAGPHRQEVEIAEYTINHQRDEILADIYRRKPDVAAFSCYIWNRAYVAGLIRDLHQIRPELPIWVGGPEVSYDAEQFLEEFPQVAGVMAGEGERSFAALAEYYGRELFTVQVDYSGRESCQVQADYAGKESCPAQVDYSGRESSTAQVDYAGREFSSALAGCAGREPFPTKAGILPDGLGAIPGILWRDGQGNIHRNAPAEPVPLDEIPFFYAEPVPGVTAREPGEKDPVEEREKLADFAHRIIYYESSRGCPFSCSYCLSSIDKRVRFRSLELVLPELQFFLDQKVPQVKFVDRTFNCSHRHAKAIWRYLAEHDNGVTNFHFEIGADLLDEEELEILSGMRPGLVQLEIGVQSVNPDTLREIRRVTDLERLRKNTARIRAGKNIHQHLDLIAGLPWEDYESFVHSFNEVYAMSPQQLQLGFLKVLKGSRMQEMAGEYGIAWRQEPPYEVLFSRWISYEELQRLKAVEEMVEVYYNSGQFAHTIRQLEQAFLHPFAMYEALAAWYDRHGLNGKNHSRMARFQILRDFARQSVPEEGAFLDELLLLDLYLRENSKQRPAWAGELSGVKDQLRSFYQQEAREPRLLSEYEGYNSRQIMNMTHAELFHYDVLHTGKELPCLAVFDYRQRDPLTGNCRVMIVGCGETWMP